MADIFRKKSLDKLSSPEQLDKMIIINSPMTWLALAGGAFMIFVALLWGIFGRVPITEEGNGILLREGEVNSVYAGTQGVVTKTNVSSGDVVKKGDVLYEVSSQETAMLVQGIKERIQKVEAVSYDSTNDIVTSDNQPLINIKNQKAELPLDKRAYKKQIKELRAKYRSKEKEVSSLKAKLEMEEDRYYRTLSSKNETKIQYEFENAATAYNTAVSVFQNADKEYQAACEMAESYKQALNEAKALYETLSQSGGQEAKAAKGKVQEAKTAYNRAKQQVKSYKKARDKAKKQRDSAKKVYKNKKAVYENYIKRADKSSAQLTQYGNDYNRALSDYNTAKSELKSIGTEIESVKVQLSVKDDSKQVQEKMLKKQFNSSKQSVLDELGRELENYSALMDGMQIKATVDGVVYSTFVTNGSAVTVDMEVARISESMEDGKLQAVYFMQLSNGKKVEKGMKVNIYPSTLSKEEYGHMTGSVVKVADYVTSAADLFTRVGDSTLAETFSAEGAVLEVVCEIERDKDTASGYAWSSKKGEGAELQEGTLLGGTVITENVPPITMLIPKLKEKFDLE